MCFLLQSHLDYALCTVPTASHSSSCAAIYHLPCLAETFHSRAPHPASTSQLPPLLPLYGSCPACCGALHWQDLIRAAYRRSEEASGAGRKKPKQKLVALKPGKDKGKDREEGVLEIASTQERVKGSGKPEYEPLDDDLSSDEAEEQDRSWAFEQERSWAELTGSGGDDGLPDNADAGHGEYGSWLDTGSSGLLLYEPSPSPAPLSPRKPKRASPPRVKPASPKQVILSGRASKPTLTTGVKVSKPRPRPVAYDLPSSSPEPERAQPPPSRATPLPLDSPPPPPARPKARRIGQKKAAAKEIEVLVISDSD